MHSTPEQLFTAFLRHRDAEALAAAFDHTAPELLRVAAFLLPADEVEDAVHDTFVVAMNRGEAWQDQRALVPWLLGILANEASSRRRRRRREQSRTAPPPAAAPDPVAAAAAGEIAAGFQRALTELPEATAELLRLHLCDELSCREIGERLHRPSGTVRTQVSRAMSELRRRLPVGLAVAGPFSSLPPGSIDALRERVLQSVGNTAASNLPTAHAATASSRHRSWTVTLPLAGAIVVTIVLALWHGFASRPAAASGAPTVAEVERSASTSTSTSREAAASAAPGPDRTPAVATEPTVVAAWQLRGRVHDEQGSGIVGATVALRFGEFEPRITSTRSGADGSFALDLSFWRDRPPLDRSRGFFVMVHAEGHNSFPYFGKFPADCSPTRPLTMPLDVDLSPYPTISGRVVDAQGNPVPAVLTAEDRTEQAGMLGLQHAEADGTFVLIVAGIQDGAVNLFAEHASGALYEHEVAVHRGLDTNVGTLVLPSGHPVTGRAVLTDGTPVPDCELSLACAEVRRSLIDGRTDAEGRFTYVRPEPVAWSAQLKNVSLLDGGIWGPRFEFEAGRTDARLPVDGALLELHWFDPDGHELLPQHGAAEIRREGNDQLVAKQDLERNFLLVPPRSHVQIAATTASGFLVAQQVVAPTTGRQRCDLHFRAAPRAPFRVDVVWDDGAPVEQFVCNVHGLDSGGRLAAQPTQQSAGRCEWLAPIGKVHVFVMGYPSVYDGGEVEVDAEAPADGSGVVKVVVPRCGRIALTLRDAAANDRIDDQFAATVQVGDFELEHFVWTDDTSEVTSSEPALGRHLDTLQLLAVGKHTVTVTADGWQPATASVDVHADAVAEVTIWLHRQ